MYVRETNSSPSIADEQERISEDKYQHSASRRLVIGPLAAVKKCKRLFAMNPMQVRQSATRGYAYPHRAPEDRVFEFFLSDPFNPVMSVSPETVPDTRSEQFRRTVQRHAGNYRRH